MAWPRRGGVRGEEIALKERRQRAGMAAARRMRHAVPFRNPTHLSLCAAAR
jgi:hypothetical protein